jgi:2-iminobutanoate/2-iminopropanoate deaminase
MEVAAMKLERIVTVSDPYEPFRLAQGYRVGDLLFISGQAAFDDAVQNDSTSARGV